MQDADFRREISSDVEPELSSALLFITLPPPPIRAKAMRVEVAAAA